jgi:predicted ABC-class ATPase
MMDDFLPLDVTQEARKIASENLTGRSKEGGSSFGEITPRVPLPESIDPEKGRKVKIKARGNEHIQFGYESIKLGYVEQIVQDSQTRAIGDIIYYALRNKIIDGKNTLSEIVWKMEDVLESYGIDEISPFGNNPVGNHARPRPLEIAAAINRLRTLKVEQKVTR